MILISLPAIQISGWIDAAHQEARTAQAVDTIVQSGAPYFTLDALARDAQTPPDVTYLDNRSAVRRNLPLARLQYDWESGAHWTEPHDETEQAHFSGLLVVRYVQLRRGVSPALAVRWMLADTMLTEADRQDSPAFDDCYARTVSGDVHEIVARSGDRIVSIEYYGPKGERLRTLTAETFGKQEADR